MNSKLRGFLQVLRSKSSFRDLSSGVEEVIIPKRISRGPTDILRALANTVQKDPTAAHYKYHDDPYLIPYSNNAKRSYALSQEAGRKAAYWVRQENSDLFQHKVAEPLIEKFVPKPVYNEESDVNEEDLIKCINNSFVSDAIVIFKTLKKKEIDIDPSIKQQLLEFLCFYNAEDPDAEEFLEERWFKQSSRSVIYLKNSWKDGGLAEELFKELKSSPYGPSAYSALICGMSSHGQIEMAYRIYEESQEKEIRLSVYAYNALLSRASSVKESHVKIWNFIQDLLREMNEKNIAPNIGTLNAILEMLSKMVSNRNSKDNALRIVSEFRRLGIEPSLASYMHLLNLFVKEKGLIIGAMNSILNHIQNKHLVIVDLDDTKFFMRAMEICLKNAQSKELAYKLNSILHFGNNYNLIGDSYKESQY